jgi:hypothetical protein
LVTRLGFTLLRAAQTFSCGKAQVSHFSEQADPFNPGNTLEGFQCRQDGPYFGSLLLTVINGVYALSSMIYYEILFCDCVKFIRELPEPEAIYGTPKIETLPARPPLYSFPFCFPNGSLILLISYRTPPPVAFYLANKWNGLNVLFFKYHDVSVFLYYFADLSFCF